MRNTTILRAARRAGPCLVETVLMFENVRLLGGAPRAIVVQTRVGSPIRNEITADPTPQQIGVFETLRRQHPHWEVRKPPTGGYNCAGHVWASRRTSICDDFDAQAQLILAEDGYRALNRGEVPQVGDLALYWETSLPRSNLHHVGVVVELRAVLQLPAGGGSPRHPWILSKIDCFRGEVVHHYNDPPVYQGARPVLEYWTDRPMPERMPR